MRAMHAKRGMCMNLRRHVHDKHKQDSHDQQIIVLSNFKVLIELLHMPTNMWLAHYTTILWKIERSSCEWNHPLGYSFLGG
jgi:hypothetical protein